MESQQLEAPHGSYEESDGESARSHTVTAIRDGSNAALPSLQAPHPALAPEETASATP